MNDSFQKSTHLLRCSITNFKQLKWAGGSCFTASRIFSTCSPIDVQPEKKNKTRNEYIFK